ncbi:MAG TPA: RIP metalloprotease RseP [Blastocatellia bacterium]|nr:RIP metalloprotease RseP [Blastocatellia bacterium]
MPHFLQSAAAFLVVLGTLILIHEFGHYLIARLFGIRVEVFSVGFGKRLLGWRRGGTDYRISLIPLGGYVQMAGESYSQGATGAPDEFLSKPKWQRFLVALAGPAMNLMLALAIPAMLAVVHNDAPAYLSEPAAIHAVDSGSPAERAGLQPGDLVLAADAQPTPDWRSVEDYIAMRPGANVELAVRRDGAVHLARVDVERQAYDDQAIGYVGLKPDLGPEAVLIIDAVAPGSPAEHAGIQPGDQMLAVGDEEIEQSVSGRARCIRKIRASLGVPLTFRVRRGDVDLYVDVTPALQDGVPRVGIHQSLAGVRMAAAHLSPAAALRQSVASNLRVFSLTCTALGQAFTGARSMRDTFSGPVQLFRYSGDAAAQGPVALFKLMAVLSLSLALFNLLPVPALDGGVMFMLGLEWLLGVFGLPLTMRAKERMLQIGAIVIMVLTGYALLNDVSRLVAPRTPPHVAAPDSQLLAAPPELSLRKER